MSDGEEMKFYSLYDLIDWKRKEKKETLDEMFLFFRKHKMKKADLLFLKENCSLESAKQWLPIVSEYTEMSVLEIYLALGVVPEDYKNAFFENIHEISKILEREKIEGNNNPEKIDCYFETKHGKLFNADCIDVLKNIDAESVDLVFADPPFNLSKVYDEGINDSLGMSEYIKWSYEWISECIRILKPGGALLIYNIPKWTTYFSDFLNKRLTLRSWIAIDMKFSLPLSGRLNPTHYALLYYIKGQKPRVFNNPRIPIQTCRHCGGEIKDYGGYKNKMNPQGVNLSDVWTDIYPVRHKNTKNRAYNELSVKMLDRIISMTTNPGDIVFDPFGGSGTTYIVSELLGRKWIGSELGNCQIIVDRFSNIEKDETLLKRVQNEKDILFPESVKELRKKNGFWLCEDFAEEAQVNDGQLDFLSMI